MAAPDGMTLEERVERLERGLVSLRNHVDNTLNDLAFNLTVTRLKPTPPPCQSWPGCRNAHPDRPCCQEASA